MSHICKNGKNRSVLCEILATSFTIFRRTSFYFVKITDSISLSIVISAASEILIQMHWICEAILTETSSEFLHRKGKTCFNIIKSILSKGIIKDPQSYVPRNSV